MSFLGKSKGNDIYKRGGRRLRTFYRFLGVGVLNTVIGYGVIFAALELGATYWTATVLGTTAGLLCSFFLNRRLTFRHDGNLWRAALRFAAASYICYFVAYMGACLLLRDDYTVPLLTADQTTAIVGGIFYTLLHYTASKRFVFRAGDESFRGRA